MRQTDRVYAQRLIHDIESRNTFVARARRTLVYSALITGTVWALTVDVPGCHEQVRDIAYSSMDRLAVVAGYAPGSDDGQGIDHVDEQ